MIVQIIEVESVKDPFINLYMLQRGSNGEYEVINLIGLSLLISCFLQEYSGNECDKQCKTSLCQWYSNEIYSHMHRFSQGIHR